MTGGIASIPTEFTFTPGNIAAGASSGPFNLTIPVAGPEGPFSFVAQAKTKVNNVEATEISQAFTVNVVRPFVIDGPATVTLIPGQAVPLRGFYRVARARPFKEAVTVAALAGLPAGVTLATPLALLPPTNRS